MLDFYQNISFKTDKMFVLLWILCMLQTVNSMVPPSHIKHTLNIDFDNTETKFLAIEKKFDDFVESVVSKQMNLEAELKQVKKENELLKHEYSHMLNRHIQLEKTIHNKIQMLSETCSGTQGNEIGNQAEATFVPDSDNNSNLTEYGTDVLSIPDIDSDKHLQLSNSTRTIKPNIQESTSSEKDSYMNTDLKCSCLRQEQSKKERKRRLIIKSKFSFNSSNIF